MPSNTTLMVQGTTSDAGKTTLVAGLGRALSRRGIQVAPFKPQNMALNSAATSDHGEIGRAQVMQAQACGIEPDVDMNPILLKPNSDTGAQVIVLGKAIGDMDAVAYHAFKPRALDTVLAAHQRLTKQYRMVLAEGAGSPAEINLRDGDIANMGFAEAANCAVIIVADIDRGGVFAHLKGTFDCLSASEQQRTIGFVINKFRGDPTLLADGIAWLERKVGKPVLAVLPYLESLNLDAEDALDCSQALTPSTANLQVAVPVLPRISNHTDFDPLRAHPDVDLRFIGPGMAIPPSDLVVLPGTKQVVDDLNWLRANGWEDSLFRHLRYGGKLMGICGGFQMLGEVIEDPSHVETQTSNYRGLGLIPMWTRFERTKQVAQRRGKLTGLDDDVPVEGYEIHCGISGGTALTRPLLSFDECGTTRFDGAISDDGQIAGTYWHGIFSNPKAALCLLHWAGLSAGFSMDTEKAREQSFERLADAVENAFDIDALLSYLNGTSFGQARKQ